VTSTAAAGTSRTPARIGIVGRGRVGSALAAALTAAGYEVDGPAGRGEVPAGDVVLLCVPDSEIEPACAVVAGRAAFVGHTSGATPLSALDAAAADGAAVFGLHPLQTIAGGDADLRGAGCGIAGSSDRALATARELAEALGMEPFELDDEQRAAYHAAASIASNYLLALEATAEAVAAGAGIPPEDARRLLGPLVRQTVANWQAQGPAGALTGPVARGDEATVARQRAAVADASPEALRLFDELTDRTRALMRVPA
jgi:predicted short-subunit dehydrogenase-like oxidoreductase (DUF2520 family)